MNGPAAIRINIATAGRRNTTPDFVWRGYPNWIPCANRRPPDQLTVMGWQRARPIDRIGLPAHIGLPRIRAGLAPATGFFFPSKRSTDLGATGADVHIGNATV